MSLLSVEHLTVALEDERKLVNDVSFAIERGEMLALVGESGSGKSLTALSVMRLLARQFHVSGSIAFDGKTLSELSEREMRGIRGADIGMIFQEPMTALNPLHTIGKQIGEAITIHHSREPELRARIMQLLEDVGLPYLKERLGAYPHELSGGERQRVMIAMAIANNPKLLIADEPTTAVDVTIQATLLTLLKKLQRERSMAMLFITHDLSLVKHMAERVAIMKQGELVEVGEVKTVWAAPQHPYTQALLKSEPKGEAVTLPADAEVLLEAKSVNVGFPVKAGVLRRVTGVNVAVKGVSLTLKKGETLGIVGESGSGKTTLAFALIRMLKASGTVVFAGREISALTRKQLHPLRREMQLVFQDPFGSLNPRMTVGQIIGEGLRVHEPDARDHEARIAQMLIDVGLSPEMAGRYPHEFSGGQRQRISIARALVLRPKLVVLDEPTSALDVTVQSQILELLKSFQLRDGISFLLISHDLRVIRAIAHRILVLRRGEMVEMETTKTLFTKPGNTYTKSMIQAAWLS